MDDVLRGLMGDFQKPELLEIAEELGLKVLNTVRAPTIINLVLDNLDEEGVPGPDDCSDPLWEFLVAADYIDEDGNLLELEENDDEQEGGNEQDDEKISHKCYGYHDAQDPACRKCKISDLCIIERQASLPECFGLLWDKTDPECDSCIEASGCRKKFENSQ